MNAKRKGTNGEHELENLLREHGIRAYRNDQIFKGGAGNPDVFAEFAGKPLHIEVKRCEKLNIHAAMEQAIRDAKGNHLPVVAHRRNREKWLVTIPLAELIDLLTEGSREP